MVIQALREILTPDVIQEGRLVLGEDDPSSTIPIVNLSKSGKVLALRFQNRKEGKGSVPVNRWLFPLFRINDTGSDVCKSCDYMIFHLRERRSEDPQLFVFVCELKSGQAKGASVQLRNGKLLADYVLSVTRLHKTCDWPDTQFRGIIFAGDAPQTKPSTGAQPRATYRPDSKLPDLWVTTARPRPHNLDYFLA